MHDSSAKQPQKRSSIITKIFPLVLVVVACLFIALGFTSFSTARSYVDSFSGDGSADPYSPTLHSRLQVTTIAVGLLTVLVAIAAAILIQSMRGRRALQAIFEFKSSMLGDLSRFFADLVACLKSNATLIIVVATLGIVLRAVNIEQPIRFDEAYTWRDYASKPLFVTVSLYDEPNNHIFHNVLLNLSLKVFGSSLISIRWISCLASLMCVVTATLTARTINENPFAGYACGILLATHSAFTEYSIYARGYTILSLMVLWSVLLIYYASRSKNQFAWILSSVFCAIGFWTIPVMLYPMLTISVTILIATEISARYLATLYWAVGVVFLTLTFYSPVLIVSGIGSITSNKHVQSIATEDYFELLGPYMSSLFDWFSRDTPWPVFLSLIAVVMLGNGLNERTTAIVKYWAVGIAILFFAVAFLRVLPPDRTWLWIVPWIAITFGTGLANTVEHLFNAHRSRLPAKSRLAHLLGWFYIIIVCMSPFIALWTGKTFDRSTEIGPCPSASLAAIFLKDNIGDIEPIITKTPSSATLDYAAMRVGLNRNHFDPILPDTDDTSVPTILVCVVNGYGFKQDVQSVLSSYESINRFLNCQPKMIWEHDELAIYRLTNPKP